MERIFEEKRFTIEEYFFIDDLVKETIGTGNRNKMEKLQVIRKKISSQFITDGLYEELTNEKDRRKFKTED